MLLTLGTDADATVTAYPTVFSDYVEFVVEEETGMSITLYNATGVCVGEWTSQDSEFKIHNLKNLSAGVYFANVKNNDNVTTIKLIKK